MSRRQKRRAMKQFLRELPPMIVIGIGLYAWALILWVVAP